MNKNYMQIGNRKIGEDYAPLVIAEIGINHEGSLKTAFEMVDAAYEAGAEVVKHQTHVVEDEMSKAAKKVIPGNTDVSIYDVMARCALNEEDETKLKEYVESKGMIFISTPFSRAAAERLERMGVQAYKIGSGECNNYPLIDLIASFGKPIILSTGMNDIDSIRKSVEIMEKHGVKYSSDHTVNNNACLAATALGASVLERHFTDSKDRPGPDIVCSMDPKELKELIEASKEIQQMRGGKKEAAKEEQVTIDFAFATVVTTKPLKKGDILTKENIWVKRPGTGEIKAEHYESLLGKVVNKDIEEDEHLCWSDIEG